MNFPLVQSKAKRKLPQVERMGNLAAVHRIKKPVPSAAKSLLASGLDPRKQDTFATNAIRGNKWN